VISCGAIDRKTRMLKQYTCLVFVRQGLQGRQKFVSAVESLQVYVFVEVLEKTSERSDSTVRMPQYTHGSALLQL
jgi:hypothetical protein